MCDYFLNEYSIRGQFDNIDDFFEKFRKYTCPVINEIKKTEQNIIWKKETFWNLEVCNGLTIKDVAYRQDRNGNNPEVVKLKLSIVQLFRDEPFYGDNDNCDIKIEEYQFDDDFKKEYSNINCFTKALENEGRVVSFFHEAFERDSLDIKVLYKNKYYNYTLDNIYRKEWWKNEPKVESIFIEDCSKKYKVEVRAKEFEYHPPHFHVSFNEYAAVFKLKDGSFWKDGKKKWSESMKKEIKDWYDKHKDELNNKWECLHKKIQ
ncbi:DUF4160 domain-containing protein [Lachnoanaerobaculum gingivalis]|uniref:DUF4160 domain-containing protein n=1 Tax=Lachnoanaerobaculum gingivalis TaxID=2490855 RepID=A0A3P3QTN5_9FIRM|nr:DUF4160 domain-containing protein [Lachnoanaerobaculum gingivalis]RRJ24592.1 DUF4160 domain-containing protein [Lachnoanaerobaculum gingivalis]